MAEIHDLLVIGFPPFANDVIMTKATKRCRSINVIIGRAFGLLKSVNWKIGANSHDSNVFVSRKGAKDAKFLPEGLNEAHSGKSHPAAREGR
jgi:hypothetical protein